MIKAVDYDSDGYDWPSGPLGRQLTSLEETLLCPICQGLFNNPQILNCGHTFCSLCIRKHFDRNLNKTTSDVCPACREKAETADLRTNRSIATAVSSFKGLRKDLMSLVSKEEDRMDCDIIDVTDSTKKSQKKERGPVVVERIAQFNFHGMSKDKMKKTIEGVLKNTRHKLPYDVDKDVLERRFREVVHLNNAQIGLDSPLSLDEIVKLVNEREAAKEAEARKACKSIAKIEKLKKGETVKELEDGFAKLTKRALELKRMKAAAATTTTQTQKEEKVEVDGVCGVDGCDEEEADSLLGGGSFFPLFDPSALSKAFESVQEPSKWGSWRVVMNAQDSRLFYFNLDERVGQFEPPEELRQVRSSGSGSSREKTTPAAATTAATAAAAAAAVTITASTTAASNAGSTATITADSMSESVAVPVAGTAGLDDYDDDDVDHLFPEHPSVVVASTGESEKVAVKAAAMVETRAGGLTEEEAAAAQAEPGNAVVTATATTASADWSCSVCTFINSSSSACCDMCGTSVAPASRPKRSIGSAGSGLTQKTSNSNSSFELTGSSQSKRRKSQLN